MSYCQGCADRDAHVDDLRDRIATLERELYEAREKLIELDRRETLWRELANIAEVCIWIESPGAAVEYERLHQIRSDLGLD